MGRVPQVQAAGAAPGGATSSGGSQQTGSVHPRGDHDPSLAGRPFQAGAGNANTFTTLGCSAWRAASNARFTSAPARPVISSSHFGVTGPGGEQVNEKGPMSARATTPVLVSGCGAGAATAPPAKASSLGGWTERIAAGVVDQRGPTFVLPRSSREVATEGVLAPTWLLALGIGNMLDFAESFDDEEEVRVASGAAAQHEQELAVQAWTQCRRRAPTLAKRMLQLPAPTTSSGQALPYAPIGTCRFHESPGTWTCRCRGAWPAGGYCPA